MKLTLILLMALACYADYPYDYFVRRANTSWADTARYPIYENFGYEIKTELPYETFELKADDWVWIYVFYPLGHLVNDKTGELEDIGGGFSGIVKLHHKIKCVVGDDVYYYFGDSHVAVCSKKELFKAMTEYDMQIYKEYLEGQNKELEAQTNYRRLLELQNCGASK